MRIQSYFDCEKVFGSLFHLSIRKLSAVIMESRDSTSVHQFHTFDRRREKIFDSGLFSLVFLVASEILRLVKSYVLQIQTENVAQTTRVYFLINYIIIIFSSH